MYEVKIVTQFAAAHRLENFRGKCESLHGHNWKVEVFLVGKNLDHAGLLMDFGVVKARTKQMLEEIDHKYLNELAAFQDRNPSSENLACYLYERLGAIFNNGDGVKVRRVDVWESDTSCASYYQD
jgi:6-pyruvoyltetrahydropterin/6-carboxytetrahydropterin synthase